jgi:prepilin-type N-terminal cleavage/methylation domain-containing protein
MGFTLTEVLVASVVVVLAIGGAYTTLLAARMVSSTARQHLEAEQIALDQIWKTYHLNYDELLSFGPNPTTDAVHENSILFNAGGTVRTAVIPNGDYCQIIVRVDWQRFGPFSGTNTPYEILTMDRYRTQI